MADTQLTAPTVIPPALDPIKGSHLASDVEADLQGAFIEVFEAMLRPQERAINGYGAPHRAGVETLERFAKADGLAMERPDSAAYMGQLFRAWRARNPRRGLSFLRHYLQLLWPGRWSVDQLWQEPSLPYPGASTKLYAPGRFLTSRVELGLELDADDTGAELSRLIGSFRAVLPARLVLETAITQESTGVMRLANIADGQLWEEFEGTAAN